MSSINRFPYAIFSAKAGRGYGFDEASPDIDKHQLEAIGRRWPPSGQAWSEMVGRRFVRTIPLLDDSVGWTEIRVTNESDEYGRKGLLWSKTSVIPKRLVGEFANDYLNKLPSSARNSSEKYGLDFWGKISLSIRTLLRSQTVVSAPADSDWQVVEAIVIRLFLSLPDFLRQSSTFSTLSLSVINMGTLVGIPTKYLKSKAHIDLRDW